MQDSEGREAWASCCTAAAAVGMSLAGLAQEPHTKLGLDPGAAVLTLAGFTGAGLQASSFQSISACIHTVHLQVFGYTVGTDQSLGTCKHQG